MAERRRRAAGEPPSEILDTAFRERDEQTEAEREKYGPRLNTVVGTRCGKCSKSASMSVHPGHRVYHPCGCAFELPPIGDSIRCGKRPAAAAPKRVRQ